MSKQIRRCLLSITKFALFAPVCLLFVTSANSQSIPSTLGWRQILNTKLADGGHNDYWGHEYAHDAAA
jgi:hypothetical protein